jgi:transcriptional regulator with AAA-type ATPase domain
MACETGMQLSIALTIACWISFGRGFGTSKHSCYCGGTEDTPFRTIDCTAIPESLFESILFGHVKGAFIGAIQDQKGLLSQSHLGTAFFDEIGELTLVL